MMNTFKKSIYISFLLILFIDTSFAQNKTRLDISTGILKDTNNNFGLNLKFSRLLSKSPLSISFGLGYFKSTHREGINQFNYEYYQNQNIVPAVSLNYEFFKTDKSLSFEVSPRLSYFLNKKEFYTSKYNARKNINEVSEKNVLINNLSIGTGLNIKKTSKKEVSLVLSMGLDYLIGDKSKLNQNLLLGVEFPLKVTKSKSDILISKNTYSTKVENPSINIEQTRKEVKSQIPIKNIQEKDSLVVKQKKVLLMDRIDSVSVIVPTKKSNTETNNVNFEKALKDTLKTNSNVDLKKPKGIIEPIVISKTKENIVKNNKITNIENIKKDTLKIKVTPIKIPKKDKKVANAPVELSVNTNELQPIKMLKVLGPMNIDGIQYELGDDWNYWLGENGYWYAKKKTKEKWYDLIKSLNDNNYDKAVQTLSKDAKKVD
jgi:hypothetical protein